ncbi:MAG: sodium-translocating pyrophosphatase, partial [Acidimicrobiales bacterium]|nr:sodium-translocating pyrophosphatase [Acidimicrobiales bacterium]
MNNVLAAEGGYQAFTLAGGEWFVLIASAVTALIAIGVGFLLMKDVLAADQGTPSMIEIASAIQEGAWAYLKRQFKTIGIILVPLAIVVFVTSVKVVKPEEAGGGVALSQAASGAFRTIAFIMGCLMSGLTGYIGMTLATRGNVRTAAAAKTGSMGAALKVAFRTGGIAGMFTVGLGLLGATVIIMLFQNTSSAILVGFGFGGSLLALFLRVGGGIFTKAADVGADLVGKVEAGIPEDDPRNPATIADNVGDNVGDCAGMAADLFESYEVTLVASIILGVSAFNSVGMNPALGLVFPLAARAIGVLASIAGVFAVRAKPGETNALKPINRGFLTAGVLTVVGTLILSLVYVGNEALDGTSTNAGWKCFGAVVIGLVLAQVVSRLTEYFTGTEYGPVKEIAESSRTGPATVVLSGTSSGLESSVYAIVAIAIALGAALALGGGNIQFSLYLVALTGMGMLATTGVVVAEDTFGPVSDNAAGIAEMSGEFHGEPERIMVALDAVGNTTKAVTKGFAIGSAVIAAVALFASYIETIASELGLVYTNDNIAAFGKDASFVGRALEGSDIFNAIETQINVADVKTFIGLLIGGSVAFMFSALAIRAVGRTAGVVVQEVRRQFADGQIMAGTRKPDYGPVIDICTAASLRELATPALLAVLTPVIIGFGIGYASLGAFLAAVILTGQLMANYLSNAGGAWDNAKKYIEDG